MKLACIAFRSISNSKASPFHGSSITTRTLFTNAFPDSVNGNNQNDNKMESVDEFEHRIFGDGGNSGSFFRKLDKLERDRNRIGVGGRSMLDDQDESFDGDDESFDTLSDGMDGKLKNAAMYFDFDLEEVQQDGYTFRPDASFPLGSTYDVKDLDLRRPGVPKLPKRHEFEVTSKEVLKKADFRNVRFLANFITDAGIIIKRSKTGISAKAQRKVAREIKTARAFGLMPFTTMGTKSFVFGRTMEDMDEDFEYEIHDSPNAGPDERGSF